MATDICIRRLTKELKSLMKDPIKNPKITVAADDSNILEVHYVIEGLEKTPYAGGFYHGKLLFPKEYPLKPPSVIMMTKNGRFQPNRRLCLSMSDFHPEVSLHFKIIRTGVNIIVACACMCNAAANHLNNTFNSNPTITRMTLFQLYSSTPCRNRAGTPCGA
uniref:UBC core domain-containing protein n=1 Tax=Pseudo-nitzschia australis TaxID=44445 RepID=A0A7S4EEG4_9STRA